jgi:hypothetical protein
VLAYVHVGFAPVVANPALSRACRGLTSGVVASSIFGGGAGSTGILSQAYPGIGGQVSARQHRLGPGVSRTVSGRKWALPARENGVGRWARGTKVEPRDRERKRNTSPYRGTRRGIFIG